MSLLGPIHPSLLIIADGSCIYSMAFSKSPKYSKREPGRYKDYVLKSRGLKS
jgi:hypothetical protein